MVLDPKSPTFWQDVAKLHAAAQQRAVDEGRNVRCPACDAGVMKPCVNAIHPARLAASIAAR